MKNFRLKNWIVPICALAMVLGIMLGKGMTNALPAAAALLLAVGAALLCRGNLRMVSAAACALCVGMVGGIWTFHPVLPAEGTYQVTGVVTDSFRDGSRNQHKTTLSSLKVNGEKISGNAYWSFYSDELPENLVPGVSVSFEGNLYHPSSADNSGGFDFREYLLAQGTTVGIYGCENLSVTGMPLHIFGTPAHLRHILTQQLTDSMGEEVGVYAAAMILGERKSIPEDDRDAFSRLGIAHVLSVSGFHVAVLAGAVGWLLTLLRVKRKPALVIKITLLTFYCLLTGLHAPVIRASVLLILYEYGAIRNRRRVSLNLLGVSAIGILFFSPAQAVSAGFHMTFGAMTGMTVVCPTIQRAIHCRGNFTEKLVSGFSAALGAQIGILLPELYWYHEVPLLGIFLNVVVIGMAAVGIYLFAAVLILSPIPVVGAVFGKAVALPVSLFLKLVRIAGSTSAITLFTKQANWLTAIGCIGLIAALCCFTGMKPGNRIVSSAAAIAVIAISLIPISNNSTKYIQLSVGNADSAVILDENRVVVIDTGEDGQALASFLGQRGLNIDTLFITHLHSDHAGGLAELHSRGIGIHQIILPYGAETEKVSKEMLSLLRDAEKHGAKIHSFGRGDTLTLPNGEITCVWPENGKVRPNQEANEYSLALLITLKGTTMLQAGDLDGKYEDYSAYPADILKAAHHGSKASSSEEFLENVSPQVLVVSCGDDERPGALAEKAPGTPMYCTRYAGDVTIRFDEGAFAVSTVHQEESNGEE